MTLPGSQINAWFIENRNPETGDYPDFPEPDDGGSKIIINPPLPSLDSILADAGDAAAGKTGKGGKAAAGKSDDKKTAAAKGATGKKGKGASSHGCGWSQQEFNAVHTTA